MLGFLEGEAEALAEKAFRGGGAEALNVFSDKTMNRLLNGGGKPLEMMQLTINYLQNLSLVALLEMPWPEWFAGFDVLTLNLSFAEDSGDWGGILIGLLGECVVNVKREREYRPCSPPLFTHVFSLCSHRAPLASPLLIYQLDHGLFCTRNDHYFVQNTVTSNHLYSLKSRSLQTSLIVTLIHLTGFAFFRTWGHPGFIGGLVFNLAPLTLFLLAVAFDIADKNADNTTTINADISTVGGFKAFKNATSRRHESEYITTLRTYLTRHLHNQVYGALIVLTILSYFIGTAVATTPTGRSLYDIYILHLYLGIAFLSFCSLLHWTYLRSLLHQTERTNENFIVSRTTREFALFLFLYLIAYLSGVNSTLTMATKASPLPSNATHTTNPCSYLTMTVCGETYDFKGSTAADDAVLRTPLYYTTIAKDTTTCNHLVTNLTTNTYLIQEMVYDFDEEGEVERTSGRLNGLVARSVPNFQDWKCETLAKNSGVSAAINFSPPPWPEATEQCFVWQPVFNFGVCDDESGCMTATHTIGWILFIFYAIAPLMRLYQISSTTHELLKISGETYVDSLEWVMGMARSKSTHSAFASADTVKDSYGDGTLLPIPIRFWEPGSDLKRIEDDYGVQASITYTLLAAFEEKWWWWKLFLMAERCLLGFVIMVEAPPSFALLISLGGFAGSYYTTPYWEEMEDKADLVARGTTSLTVFVACLVEWNAIDGDEILVAILVNVCAIATLIVLVIALGPKRMLVSAMSLYNLKKRELRMQLSANAVDGIEARDVAAITRSEFLAKSTKIR